MVVAVAGGLSVTGVLPGTAWRPEGTIAISGELGHLWRGQAGELADALHLVVERMDVCAQQRYASMSAGAVALLGEG
jgi:hypothetical protein